MAASPANGEFSVFTKHHGWLAIIDAGQLSWETTATAKLIQEAEQSDKAAAQAIAEATTGAA